MSMLLSIKVFFYVSITIMRNKSIVRYMYLVTKKNQDIHKY